MAYAAPPLQMAEPYKTWLIASPKRLLTRRHSFCQFFFSFLTIFSLKACQPMILICRCFCSRILRGQWLHCCQWPLFAGWWRPTATTAVPWSDTSSTRLRVLRPKLLRQIPAVLLRPWPTWSATTAAFPQSRPISATFTRSSVCPQQGLMFFKSTFC